MTVKVLLAIFAVALALGDISMAQKLESGCCPEDIEVESNFKLTQFLGTWYEYAKYPEQFERNGVCITAQYSLQSDGVVAVKNSLVDALTGATQDIQGTASVVSDAKLLVKFAVSQALNVSSNYWVLGTDYTNYCVVYSCQPLSDSLYTTSVWILTRERLPTASVIDAALSVLKQNDISLDPLTLTNQVACQ